MRLRSRVESMRILYEVVKLSRGIRAMMATRKVNLSRRDVIDTFTVLPVDRRRFSRASGVKERASGFLATSSIENYVERRLLLLRSCSLSLGTR